MSASSAQSLPPVRALGPVLSTSTEPMAAVSQVRALPGGRVIVNDNTGRRLLLFDSTLTKFSVIADSTSATAHAYGGSLGGLIAYRGDSSLFVDPALLAMYVIDPNGKLGRTMAVPQASEVPFLIGGPFGTPAVDPQGRLVYKSRVGGFSKNMPAPVPGQPPPPDIPDSGMVVRFSLATRGIDTVGKFVIPSLVTRASVDENRWLSIVRIVNPIPWTDDWAMLSDGTVAIAHGQDYRVDFFDAGGKLTLASKIPFDWQRLSDDDKAALIDSAQAVMDRAAAERGDPPPDVRRADSLRVMRRMAAPELTLAPRTGSAGGRAGNASSITQFVALNEMPDYRPPFRQAAARGDADGNLWIRTSKMVNGGAVYDVINRKGVLVDRIQVPPGRVIAGFGAGGVVYMGVLDGTIARLERARVRPATLP